MHVTSECFIPFLVSFVVQKDSIYKERLDQLIRRMQEAGLINHWYRVEMEKVAKLAKRQTKSTSVEIQSIEHYKGPFALYCLLIGVAILVFVMELALSKPSLETHFSEDFEKFAYKWY